VGFNIKLFVTEITELKKKNQFKKAEVLLEEKLKEHPKNIFLINSLMEICLDTRFDRSVGLLNTAIKLGVADTITYSIMLNKFIEKEDFLNVDYFFKKCITNSKEDTCICNNMLKFYLKSNDFENAGNVFTHLISTNKVSEITYSIILSNYYTNKMYLEGLRLISNIPSHIKKNYFLKTHEIEFNRKLKNYDLCLDLISNNLKDKNISHNDATTLQTIKAYCLKEMGHKQKAIELFRELLKNINEDNPSYVRIICGLIYCGDVKIHERALFNRILVDAQKENKGNSSDVTEALKKL